MRILLSTLLPVSFCVGMIACSPAADTATTDVPLLDVQLYVRYLQDDKHLLGEALYYTTDTSGTTPAEPFPEQVQFMNRPTEARILSDTRRRYTATLRGQDIPAATNFVLPTSGGDLATVTLPLAPVTDFTFPTPASLGKAVTLQLDAPPLSADEKLVLLFMDAQEQTETIIVQGPTPNGTLTLEKETLAELLPGDYRVYLVRRRTWREEELGRSLAKSVEFYTQTKSVTFVK